MTRYSINRRINKILEFIGAIPPLDSQEVVPTPPKTKADLILEELEKQRGVIEKLDRKVDTLTATQSMSSHLEYRIPEGISMFVDLENKPYRLAGVLMGVFLAYGGEQAYQTVGVPWFGTTLIDYKIQSTVKHGMPGTIMAIEAPKTAE